MAGLVRKRVPLWLAHIRLCVSTCFVNTSVLLMSFGKLTNYDENFKLRCPMKAFMKPYQRNVPFTVKHQLYKGVAQNKSKNMLFHILISQTIQDVFDFIVCRSRFRNTNTSICEIA